MNTHQLLELAQLDAMGLLDEAERQAFESALQAAPPALQRAIREEQMRFAGGLQLPEVDPPAGLRQRVVDAVGREIAALTSAAGSAIPFPRAESAPVAGRRVSSIWRTGAIALATAAVLLGAVTVHMMTEINDLNRRISNDAVVAEMSKRYGTAFVKSAIFSPDTQRVTFTKTSSATRESAASVFVNPEWGTAKLFCTDLPPLSKGTYRVAVVDASNNVVQVIAEIESNGGLLSQDIPAASLPKAGAAERLAVVRDVIEGGASRRDIVLKQQG